MDIIGTGDSSGLYCMDCSYETIQEDELRYLRYGLDKPLLGEMTRFPRLDQDGQKVLNKKGKPIIDKNVKLPKGYQVVDSCDFPIGLITHLSCDTLNGDTCAKCGEWLVEPFKLNCFDCGETVASGSKALALEKLPSNPSGFSFDELYCQDCRSKHQRERLDKVLEEMAIEHARLRQAENPILTILGKVTGIDRLFYPRLSLMREYAERVRHATDIIGLQTEIRQDYREAVNSSWERIQVLTFCLETIEAILEQEEDIDFKRLSELQKRLAA